MRRVMGPDDLNQLDDKTGAESIPILEVAIAKLKDNVHPDYWQPTEGNVKKCLQQMLAFAQARPDGIWSIGS